MHEVVVAALAGLAAPTASEITQSMISDQRVERETGVTVRRNWRITLGDNNTELRQGTQPVGIEILASNRVDRPCPAAIDHLLL